MRFLALLLVACVSSARADDKPPGLLGVPVKVLAAGDTTLMDIFGSLDGGVTGSFAVDIRRLALLNAIPDMIFRLDRDGRFIDHKAERESKLYLDPEYFLGKSYKDVKTETERINTSTSRYISRTNFNSKFVY